MWPEELDMRECNVNEAVDDMRERFIVFKKKYLKNKLRQKKQH